MSAEINFVITGSEGFLSKNDYHCSFEPLSAPHNTGITKVKDYTALRRLPKRKRRSEGLGFRVFRV